MAVVRRLAPAAKARLFGDPDRSGVVRCDDAHCSPIWEMRTAPGLDRSERLGCVAFALRRARQHPAALQHPAQRWFDVALEFGEADVADITAARLLLDRPVPEAEQAPRAGVGQQSPPGFLAGRGLAADVARHLRIGPDRAAPIEVFGTVRAQAQARSFQ